VVTLAGITETVTNPWVVALIGGAILLSFAVKAFSIRERERSRREIAAYIAEGSMTAEDGARLLAAGEAPKNE
jgi:hypothetical protein